jgi:hypothetical protein
MGGTTVSTNFGGSYRDWLIETHDDAHGNGDLSAHFYRRAAILIGAHGTVGLISTNTISQGDTRATGLRYLLSRGFVIYDATRSMPWPGDAAVEVALVHLAGRSPRFRMRAFTTRRPTNVDAINSRLRGSPEREDPVAPPRPAPTLKRSRASSFYGDGFILGTHRGARS